MLPFGYKDGLLHCEDVPLGRIAKQFGTPFYVYSTLSFRQAYLDFDKAFSDRDKLICFAVKANANPYVLRVLGSLGCGADVVSYGEMHHAIKAGISPRKIVFSGVGKTKQELANALQLDIFQINVESEQEMRLLNDVAAELGKVANIALRVNPDVDAGTHDKITTGKADNKFGIAWDDVMRLFHLAGNLPGVNPVGLAVHIGSQLTSLAPFQAAFTKVVELVEELRRDGTYIKRLDLGGGLGVPYMGETVPSITAYADMVKSLTKNVDATLIFEPGRHLIAMGGALVGRVIYVKHNANKRFAIIDAAMNDFMRPALYNAKHQIWPVKETAKDEAMQTFDVVGPICETSDVFAHGLKLPELASGNLLAVMGTGAYGSSLSSTYNCRPPAPEIIVAGDKFALIKQRPTLDDIMQHYCKPTWI